MTSTTSIDYTNKSTSRQSNFELLRIVAMFLVLIVHADFFSLGTPTHEDCIQHPVSSMLRFIIQSLSLVCVNVYIIISGYFGIKIKTKSVLNFLFMVLFWKIIIIFTFFVGSHIGLTHFNLSPLQLIKLCVPGSQDWFVSAYILLLFIAPMINDFMEKRSAKQLCTFLALYMGLQIVFSWLIQIYTQFDFGYSVLSFIGLYVLGGVIKLTGVDIVKRPFILYLFISFIIGLIVYLTSRYCPSPTITAKVISLMGSYNGLFILLASAFLFLGFGKLSIKSSIINKIAASSFAVYLFHMHPFMRSYYSTACRYLYENFSTIPYIFLITGFIICVFFTAVSIDFIRRWIWTKIAQFI